jgi:hypothetical protein
MPWITLFALDNLVAPQTTLFLRKQGCFTLDNLVPPQTTLPRRR